VIYWGKEFVRDELGKDLENSSWLRGIDDMMFSPTVS
jgi:hypothetical protein